MEKNGCNAKQNVVYDQSVYFDKEEHSYDLKGRHSLCLEKAFGFYARFARKSFVGVFK